MNDVSRESRSLEVATPDGHSAALVVVAAHDPRGHGPQGLIWLPALGVAARKYVPFAQALAARGITVAVHEWRGTGTSSVRASRASDWGYRTLLDDIAATRAAVASLDRSNCGSGVSREDSSRDTVAPTHWSIGGHSLGAQLAALALARDPGAYAKLAFVAGGVPDWRAYPAAQLPKILTGLVFFRALAALVGYFPGPRVAFAGNEARSVMREWSRSGLTGRYMIEGVGDLDAALAPLATPTFALRMAHDWLAPEFVVEALVRKLPNAPVVRHALGPDAFVSAKADHFGWLREPEPVAERLAAWLDARPEH